MTIGLFYGSTTCYTEMTAEKIQAQMASLFELPIVDLYNIKDTGLSKIVNYDWLILGISTWDFGELQEDWESQWTDLANYDLTGKAVALYGQGDQEGYAEWFQDALGMLHQVAIEQGARVVGYWPNTQEYEFIASKALTEDNKHFVGLALDDEGQFELSDERIRGWCEQVMTELA